MGNLKNKVLSGKSDGGKEYPLTEYEVNYFKIMNAALQYSTLHDKLMSGYAYTIAQYRLGYNKSDSLIFETDLGKKKPIIKIIRADFPTDPVLPKE